jgi:DNA-binding response OmpR family regulator
MTRILLVDSDENHAYDVRAYLESWHYSVRICHDNQDAIDALRSDRTGFEVLLIYISGDHREDWALLDSLRREIKSGLPVPGILCGLRDDKGPNVILMAEHKGARCVIEE